MDVLILFDTEDIFSPPDVGNDDSIKELADIMSDVGLPGVFLLIGDKVTSLRERGRDDVIESLRRHEIGLHTRSALHPCSPEYVANRDWDDGVALALQHEREGTALVADVFGQPACALSTHWMFASPHSLRAAAILDLPYIYAYPSAPPLHSISRYAGALCLPWASPTLPGQRMLSFWDGFDSHYHDPKAFEQYCMRFEQHLDACVATEQPFLSLLLYHPQRVRLREFIDNFITPNGHNLAPSQWGSVGYPTRYTKAEVQQNLDSFRQLAKRIAADERLHPITMAELRAKYDHQAEQIDRAELLDYAERIANDSRILLHETFSPAELLVAMAEMVVKGLGAKLPHSVPRRNVNAPTTNLLVNVEVPMVKRDVLIGHAEALLGADGDIQLPSYFGDAFPRVGLNHFYAALAEILTHLASHREVPTEIALRDMPRYPDIAVSIGQQFMAVAEGDNIDPNLNVDALYRHGKLQTWTLKPSWMPRSA